MTKATITPAIAAFIANLPREGWALRGSKRRLRHGNCCPLTVATNQATQYWRECFRSHGLTGDEAEWIVIASDRGSSGADNYDPALRATLLAHCGLTEGR